MSNKLISHNSCHNFLLSLETQGIKLGLSRTKKLLDCCENPQKQIKTIQIIGTNGKGSTASLLSSILGNSGYNVGLYTSPHLVKLNERIQINRTNINNNYINTFIKKYKNDIINLNCTFFETLTVLALKYFINKKVDIAILETGLGGRYDSVSACNPQLQIFTKISMDHMHILGTSLKKIAKEKASAIQKKIPCISVKQDEKVKLIMDNIAKEKDTIINYNIYNSNIGESPLNGEHQKENILLAKYAAKVFFNINDENINQGIKKLFWPGRLQTLQYKPHIIFDVAHNEDSMLGMYDFIKSLQTEGKLNLLISIQKTKKLTKSINKLKKIFDVIICTKINTKMYSEKELSIQFSPFTDLRIETFSNTLIKNIINNLNKNDTLVIVGSHYWGQYIEKTFKNPFVDRSYK